MLKVTIKENESFEKAVRRFETECRKAGIPQSVLRKRYYVKPSRKKYLNKLKARSK